VLNGAVCAVSISPDQWADCGKHGLQEAKKLEQDKRPKRQQAVK